MSNAGTNMDFLNREIKPGDLVSHVSSGHTQILISRVASFTPKRIRLTRLILPGNSKSKELTRAYEDDSLYDFAMPSQICLVQTVDGRSIDSGFTVFE